MNRTDLHNLIERYFNAETSVEEERILRRELSGTTADGDPLADQARAVMGFSLVKESAQTGTSAHRILTALHPWRKVAAAIAAVAVTGSIISGVMRQPEGECVAYLNGQRISDRQAVMEMMFADLNDMGEASADIQADIALNISEIADAINSLD